MQQTNKQRTKSGIVKTKNSFKKMGCTRNNLLMSAKRKIKAQAIRIAELGAELFKAKEEIRRLTAHTTAPQSAKDVSHHAPVITLGCAFSSADTNKPMKMTFASAPTAPRPVVEPTKAPEPEVQAVEPKAPAEEQDSDQLGSRAAKPRTLSVFKDDSIKNYDKRNKGVTLGVKTLSVSASVFVPTPVQNTYLVNGACMVNGVQIKAPISIIRKKWESVEVCKPNQPRRFSRCWRRGGAPKPAVAQAVLNELLPH